MSPVMTREIQKHQGWFSKVCIGMTWHERTVLMDQKLFCLISIKGPDTSPTRLIRWGLMQCSFSRWSNFFNCTSYLLCLQDEWIFTCGQRHWHAQNPLLLAQTLSLGWLQYCTSRGCQQRHPMRPGQGSQSRCRVRCPLHKLRSPCPGMSCAVSEHFPCRIQLALPFLQSLHPEQQSQYPSQLHMSARNHAIHFVTKTSLLALQHELWKCCSLHVLLPHQARQLGESSIGILRAYCCNPQASARETPVTRRICSERLYLTQGSVNSRHFNHAAL